MGTGHDVDVPADVPADAVARVGERFALTWSSVPPDLPEKVSASQLRALIAIRTAGIVTISDLSRRLDALPSSITRLCDRLVAAGYIDRQASPANRRFHEVRLSEAGTRLLQALDQHRLRAIDAVLRAMDPADRRALLVGLTRFAATAEEAGHPALGEDGELDGGLDSELNGEPDETSQPAASRAPADEVIPAERRVAGLRLA